MRYPAAEKLEIIRLVEQSRLPVRRTLDKLGILPARFYRWYDRYQSGGYEALKDRPPRPKQVWTRIPDDVDMSHICSGSLIGYFTNKENHHGTQTQRRIQA